MRLILCGQKVKLNLKLKINNNKKEQVINLTCSFFIYFSFILLHEFQRFLQFSYQSPHCFLLDTS